MGREFELKYAADPEQQAALQRDFALTWQEFAMETTYYDTASGDLSRFHWTLRRRFENGRSICTVKTPSPDGGRGEWELECDNIVDAIPELCKLGAPEELESLCKSGLIPICSARFVRKAGTFTLRQCVLEIALDKGILFGNNRELPLCEIEVELKSGSREAADAFAAQLADIYGLQPEEKSKFARALALCDEG